MRKSLLLGVLLAFSATAFAADSVFDVPLQVAAADTAAEMAVDEAAEEEFDFFSDEEIVAEDLVVLPPERPKWQTVGGPIALGLFFFVILWLTKVAVPFRESKVDLLLYDYPTGVKRGLAAAICLYGIAFVFGGLEIVYQLKLHGDAVEYFQNMSQGKLIAFTHAHLFGFTTTFLIIGIPFSMQFNHIPAYQWFLPVGLAASMTDIISWWGIKYVHGNFEWISIFCGIIFGIVYMYMLIGLLRVIWFPQVIWVTDKDAEERAEKIRESRELKKRRSEVEKRDRQEDEFGSY